MKVFVKNMRGQALMPCSQRKARILLKENKAKIISYKPFAIQLTYATGEATQEVNIGIDEGARYIGVAITSNNNVLAKGEIELRQGVKELLKTRADYRGGRRYRKTRYRQARFLNRKKPVGWLPPSIQSRIDNTWFWIDKFCNLLPNPKLHIEVGKFDVAKMINPAIQGVGYQQGQCYGYHEVRYFVFARDNYTCQICKKKDDNILNTHHIVPRAMGGTDRADNLLTVGTKCHTSEAHKKGGKLYKLMLKGIKLKQYTEPPFMNILRTRTYQKYPNARITYGSETTPKRKELGLEKTHYNDAIAISNINTIDNNTKEAFYITQFRKKKRSLHTANILKGGRRPNRNVKECRGFYLNDEVLYENQHYWIQSFGGEYYVYLQDVNGNAIKNAKGCSQKIPTKKLTVLCHNNNWRYYVGIKAE